MAEKIYTKHIGYSGYCTIFSAKGTRDVKMNQYACFAEVLNRGINLKHEIYEIFLFRDFDKLPEFYKRNYCPLSKEQLNNHIKYATRLFPFKYSITETNYERYDAYEVCIDIDLPHIYHRYLLTWIRYAYEFPFNVILRDAYKLKLNYFKKETISNLFIVVSNCICSGNYNSGHSIAIGRGTYQEKISYLLKESSLKTKIPECFRLNDIYPFNTKYFNDIPSIPSKNIKYIDYWSDEEEFLKRVEYYKKAYKILKRTKA